MSDLALILICCCGAVAVLAIAVGILIVVRRRKGVKKVDAKTDDLTAGIMAAVGGAANFCGADFQRSRLYVRLKDTALVDEGKLRELGLNQIIVMENKVAIVVGALASELADGLTGLSGQD